MHTCRVYSGITISRASNWMICRRGRVPSGWMYVHRFIQSNRKVGDDHIFHVKLFGMITVTIGELYTFSARSPLKKIIDSSPGVLSAQESNSPCQCVNRRGWTVQKPVGDPCVLESGSISTWGPWGGGGGGYIVSKTNLKYCSHLLHEKKKRLTLSNVLNLHITSFCQARGSGTTNKKKTLIFIPLYPLLDLRVWGSSREGECTNLIEAAPRPAKVPSTKTGAKKSLQQKSCHQLATYKKRFLYCASVTFVRGRERDACDAIDITLKSRVIMHMITSTARRPNA